MFWEYLAYQLKTQFPKPRDCREVMPKPEPEEVYQDELIDLLDYFADITKQAYTSKLEEIKESELKEVEGLLEIEKKKDEIVEKLRIEAKENPDVKTLLKIIKELKESGKLPKFKELSEERRQKEEQEHQ